MGEMKRAIAREREAWAEKMQEHTDLAQYGIAGQLDARDASGGPCQ
jgi:hypothetical protein